MIFYSEIFQRNYRKMMIKWRYKVTALYVSSGLKLRVCTKIIFSYFLTKAYVVGTQKEPSQ